jgi:hypothetical protein
LPRSGVGLPLLIIFRVQNQEGDITYTKSSTVILAVATANLAPNVFYHQVAHTTIQRTSHHHHTHFSSSSYQNTIILNQVELANSLGLSTLPNCMPLNMAATTCWWCSLILRGSRGSPSISTSRTRIQNGEPGVPYNVHRDHLSSEPPQDLILQGSEVAEFPNLACRGRGVGEDQGEDTSGV